MLIEFNGEKYEFNSLDDLKEFLTKKEINFNAVKQEKFNENSDLVKLIDSLFKGLYKSSSLNFPELNTLGNESVAVFSDYGGEHSNSKYNTYSFLFIGWNHSYGAKDLFKQVREKHQLNDKEVSFKDLRFGPIKRALDDYLNVFENSVTGLLLTVVIEKQIGPFFVGQENKHLLKEIENAQLGNWSIKKAEKLMRILHIISYILPLIAESDKKILWFTDNDSIAANDQIFTNTQNLLMAVLKIYTDTEYPLIGGATPFKKRDTFMLDLLSITDLVAGSTEQFFTNSDDNNEPLLKEGADKVLKWLGKDGVTLKKQTLRVYKKDDRLRIESIVFDSK